MMGWSLKTRHVSSYIVYAVAGEKLHGDMLIF